MNRIVVTKNFLSLNKNILVSKEKNKNTKLTGRLRRTCSSDNRERTWKIGERKRSEIQQRKKRIDNYFNLSLHSYLMEQKPPTQRTKYSKLCTVTLRDTLRILPDQKKNLLKFSKIKNRQIIKDRSGLLNLIDKHKDRKKDQIKVLKMVSNCHKRKFRDAELKSENYVAGRKNMFQRFFNKINKNSELLKHFQRRRALMEKENVSNYVFKNKNVLSDGLF